jgi:hypothetical protein
LFFVYHSPFLQSQIDSKVENAESDEGKDTCEDEFGQVVVEEDVVQVESQICRKDSDKSFVEGFSQVGFCIKSEMEETVEMILNEKHSFFFSLMTGNAYYKLYNVSNLS